VRFVSLSLLKQTCEGGHGGFKIGKRGPVFSIRGKPAGWNLKIKF
jgi:hypothetical protein